MSSLQEKLTNLFADAFEACGFDRGLGKVVVSQRPELGQFQCNGALPAAKQYQQKPRDIAQNVIDALATPEIFTELSLAGPGFINASVTDDYLAAHAQEIEADARFGVPTVETPRNIIIDFGAPNVAKAMHVGHLRTSIIGDSLQRLYRFMGDDVIGDSHLGDWGVQMGMIIYAVAQHAPDLPYFNPDRTDDFPDGSPVTMDQLNDWYPSVSAQSAADPAIREAVKQATVELQQGRAGYRALWQRIVDMSNEEQAVDFETLGIKFDYIFGESHYHDMIPTMLAHLKEEDHTEMSQGALVLPLKTANGEKEMPPLILVKSDGGYMYGTSDLATVIERVNRFKADLVLYVIDARQSFHMKQVITAAKQASLAPDTALVHVSYGTVNGPDGKPFKTRSGDVMHLKILLNMSIEKAHERMTESDVATDYDEAERQDIAKKVGIATLKYADLMNDRTSNYVFDLDRFSKFEGRTGPYLLYTAVRIKSILRRAEAESLTPGTLQPPTTQAERDLILAMDRLPALVQQAYDEYSPKYLCDFAYDLAQTFNQFYNHCHIMNETDPARQASWLALSKLCLDQLELILDLIGVETPERM